MSTIIKPETVEARERDEFNALQRERRRLAHDYMVAYVTAGASLEGKYKKAFAQQALDCADALIAKTELKK